VEHKATSKAVANKISLPDGNGTQDIRMSRPQNSYFSCWER